MLEQRWIVNQQLWLVTAKIPEVYIIITAPRMCKLFYSFKVFLNESRNFTRGFI